MSKKLYFCIIGLCLFFLTGCGKNSLNCSINRDYGDDLKIYQELKIKFSNNHVSKLNLSMNASLDGEYVNNKSSLIESVENEFSRIPEKNYVKYSSKDTSEGFNFNVKINYNKLSDDSKKLVSVINYGSSYDSVKLDLEESGYTCK